MLAVLFTVVAAQGGPIVLHRGSEIAGSDTRYWSVEDTQVEKASPDRSSGQGLVLFLGKDKRAFLRFGDLQRALGPNKRVVSARLVLTPSYLSTGGKLTIRRFSGSWHESPGTGHAQPETPRWATTWNHQHFGTGSQAHRWRDGGRELMAQTASAEVDVAASAETVVLDGLAADVQGFYDRWYENHGWAIEYTGDGGFNSAENRDAGPRLEVMVADAPVSAGPDLSVTFIERTPEYSRYDNRGNAYVRATVDGHESGVLMNPGEATSKKWPSDGEEVTYTAHIKNVGDQPSNGFRWQWSNVFSNADSGEFTGTLLPGNETVVTFKTRFRNEHGDHRTMPIGLRVTPNGTDALQGNNYLQVQANALNLGIWVDQGTYDLYSSQVNGVGSKSFEDWIQWQFRIWNDVFLRHSRFAAAEDGSRESVRIGRITIVPNGSLAGSTRLPGDQPNLVYDGEWGFDSTRSEYRAHIEQVRRKVDRALLFELSRQIGIADLGAMSVRPFGSLSVRLTVDGRTPARGTMDMYAGLMHGGDTRNDLLIPFRLPMPFTPSDDITYISPMFKPTDLYARTDIVGLNSRVGFRGGFYGEYLYSIPQSNAVHVTDRSGKPLPKGTVAFYQMKDGAIPDGEPDFVVDFENGIGQMPNRPTGIPTGFTTLTKHTLAPNPLGRFDVMGKNGVFLIRLDYAGITEWQWLKVWQMYDLANRGGSTVTLHALRFNVTDRPLLPQDWALRKTAIDSINSDGANLAALLDGDPTTVYRAGNTAGDWVEIDIGRDRPIGEIRLLMPTDSNEFWNKFEIRVYNTAQTVNQARVYASEADWQYAVNMEADVDAGRRSVPYRAFAQSARFIRIVNKSGGPGTLAGIEVRETEPAR